MRMYPAYRLRDVLDEYAVTFFALLNEGYRLHYSNAMLLAQIADLPNMKPHVRQQFYKQLEWASTSPSDILKTDDTDNGIEDIKRMLGKF